MQYKCDNEFSNVNCVLEPFLRKNTDYKSTLAVSRDVCMNRSDIVQISSMDYLLPNNPFQALVLNGCGPP